MYLQTKDKYEVITKAQYYRGILGNPFGHLNCEYGGPNDLLIKVQYGVMFITGKNKGKFIPDIDVNGPTPPRREELDKLFYGGTFIQIRQFVCKMLINLIGIVYVLCWYFYNRIFYNLTELQQGAGAGVLAVIFAALLLYSIVYYCNVEGDTIYVSECK